MDNVKQLDDLHEALASTESELRDAREALARVEAKHATWMEQYDSVVRYGNELLAKHDTAQAQLADAVGLLGTVAAHYVSIEKPEFAVRLNDFLARHAQAEQQEAPKRGKPDWNSHGYDQIFQTSDGNWFGARAGWDFKGHISDEWKGREVSLLRDDGAFLAYGEPNPDWENSLEQRPAKEAQGAQASEFQREDRYIVIKRKDLGAVPLEVRESLGVALFQLSKHLPKRECLVIESDWPEYEPTWAAIQARMTGKGAQAGDERAVFCDAVREAAKEFLDTVDEEGLKRDAFGEFVHPEPKQLLRICQLYRAALATQPAVRGAENEQ